MGHDLHLDFDLDFAQSTIHPSGHKIDIIAKHPQADVTCKVTLNGRDIPATLRRIAGEWEAKRMPLNRRLRDVSPADIGEMAAREHAYGDDGEGTVEQSEAGPVRYKLCHYPNDGRLRVVVKTGTLEEMIAAKGRLQRPEFYEILTEDGRTVPDASLDEIAETLGATRNRGEADAA